jgi:hypothetical protein
MRRFIQNSRGMLIDLDRIDAVVRANTVSGWSLLISGMAIPVSAGAAAWITSQILQDAQVLTSPDFELGGEPQPPDEQSNEPEFS